MQAENLHAATGFVSRAKCGNGPKTDGLVKKNEQLGNTCPGDGLHDTNIV